MSNMRYWYKTKFYKHTSAGHFYIYFDGNVLIILWNEFN